MVVALFAISWLLRPGTLCGPVGLALTFSFLSVALVLVTGWLGGELVDRVGVDQRAHLSALSSLSDHPAHVNAGPTGGQPLAQ